MDSNVSTADRIIRVVLGVAIVAFAFYSRGAMRWIGVAGLVLIVTALVRFCPLYWMLKIRTLGSGSSRASAR